MSPRATFSRWCGFGLVFWFIVSPAGAVDRIPEVVLIHADASSRLTVQAIVRDHVTLPADAVGLVVWGDGDREFWQVFSGQWTRPQRSAAQRLQFDLASVTRGPGRHSASDHDLAQVTTQLAQLSVSAVFRAVGSLITPYQDAMLLSPQVTFRRQPGEDQGELPAARASILRDGQEIASVEFPANVVRVRWSEIPDLPEALEDELPLGNYQLRHEGPMGIEVVRFRVLGKQQQRARMAHADALQQLLNDPRHPLIVQVTVDELLAHQPAFLADALDTLDVVPPEQLTPHLTDLRHHVIARLEDPGQAVPLPEAPGEPTGDPSIDQARSLIFAGRWEEATDLLDSLPGDAPAKTRATADLYRAVILAESGPGKEEEALALFRRAIDALERLARSASRDESDSNATSAADLFRAHNNLASFLVGCAQNRLHNHAFQMAAGVRRPLLTALARYIEARRHYERALELAQTPAESNAVRINLARLHFLLSDIVRTLEPPDDPASAISAVMEATSTVALDLLPRIADDATEEPTLQAVGQELRAALAFRTGDIDAAREHAESALDKYLHAGSLLGAESAHRLLGLCHRAAGGPDGREDALKHFLISQQLAELLRDRYPSDEIGLARAGFLSRRTYVNEQIVELLIEQGQHREALLVAEAAKARALQDVLAVAGISDRSSTVAHEVDFLLNQWPSGYAAVQYFLGSERAWVFVIDPEGKVTSYRLTNPSGEPIASRDLVGSVQEFLDGVDGNVRNVGVELAARTLARRSVTYPRSWQDQLHGLFQTLIPEQVLQSLRTATTVVIVPHHILHYFPFAALVTELDAAADATRMPLPRFFVEEPFALLHVPSLTTWQRLRQRENRPLDQVHVIGIVDFGLRATRLPNVAQELTAVRSVFGARLRTDLTEADATEGSVRRILGQPGIVVLATHGQKQPDRPLEGHLMFHADERFDGYLTAAEIYGIPVQSDLVMLTACYGGFGDRSPMPGDDLFGIQRALLHSGARAVFSGLWDVHDGTAPDLVESFSQNLAAGAPAPLAWADTQRAFLHKWRDGSAELAKFFTHPYYWAVFTVTGDGRIGAAPLDSAPRNEN